jgi:2-desacetyl-2-hydroxyethyl bacteriochlorophyllide A dehydrogenase
MKALVWEGGQRMEYGELPDPTPEPRDVVVEVELAGICGSDLHAYKGNPGPRVPPLILGHEVVGTVSGERVVVYPLIGCGDCPECWVGNENLCLTWQLVGMHRPGVFAERVCVPARCVVPVDDAIPSERAVLTEPLACCVGALRSTTDPGRVLVVGCGPLGLLTTLLASRAGGEVVAVDPLPERRLIAQTVGAADVGASYTAAEHGAFDLVIDAAGYESTWRTGIDALRPNGELVILGLGQPEGSFPMAVLVRRAIRVRGQFAYSRTDFETALDVLGDLSLVFDWVEDVPLGDGAAAFRDLAEHPDRFTKVLLRP